MFLEFWLNSVAVILGLIEALFPHNAMIPDPPPLGSLRLATPDDVMRLGVVCTASFYYSEEFTWERIYHDQYPQSTIVHYRNEAVEFINEPEFITLVIEDDYDTDESSKTNATIPEDNGWEPPEKGTKVVVGMAVWKLESGSKRIGRFQNLTGNFPDVPEYDYKDVDMKRTEDFAKIVEAAEEKYIHGLPAMERIAVHPAYWRRGHGTQLAAWGVKLSDIDGVDQGVLANSMGQKLFEHVGYELLDVISVPGDTRNPKGTDFAVLKHTAQPQ
ncbi:hypothetical protein F5Y04DRAFT_245811 [Hypomontagnella monticulosa]|nr:hypothetical protein F5Y04DRAFT_245811 [Hypomontagnella monticulosa]